MSAKFQGAGLRHRSEVGTKLEFGAHCNSANSAMLECGVTSTPFHGARSTENHSERVLAVLYTF
eukprot:9890228-Alexandrium_andersonii.AAC.1